MDAPRTPCPRPQLPGAAGPRSGRPGPSAAARSGCGRDAMEALRGLLGPGPRSSRGKEGRPTPAGREVARGGARPGAFCLARPSGAALCAPGTECARGGAGARARPDQAVAADPAPDPGPGRPEVPRTRGSKSGRGLRRGARNKARRAASGMRVVYVLLSS